MPKHFRFYYGWVNVAMAAVAMIATLPGRTHGLGLIAQPLRQDLGISESTLAMVNFWSILLGAGFAIPVGLLIDRYGVRWPSGIVLAGLAGSVYWLAIAESIGEMFFSLVMIRGLGQSALSTLSLTLVSKWFRGRLAVAMGLYAVLLTCGFVVTVLGVGWAVGQWGWRLAWQSMAGSLLAAVPLFWLVVRSSPEAANMIAERESPMADESGRADESAGMEFTLAEALCTPAFWIIAMGTSAFNLVWSSITLFNESILLELEFGQSSAVEMMAYLTGLGLVSNLIAARWVTRRSIGRWLGGGLLAMAVVLAWFPSVQSMLQLRLYGAVMGAVGGLITVVHFAAWGQLFGRRAIGSIQGAAQGMTVLASAVGPLVMAWYADTWSTHLPVFLWLAALACTMAVASFLVPIPVRPNNRLSR
jgi:MFS family permease